MPEDKIIDGGSLSDFLSKLQERFDNNTVHPDNLMTSKEINNDPKNITNDQGQIVDRDTWDWKNKGNPFQKMIDGAGKGSVFGLLKDLGVLEGSNPTNVGSATQYLQPGADQPTPDATNPTPMKDQRQKRFADTSVRPPLEPGNIDLSTRPQHTNPDGSVSTVLTKSFNFDGKEVLLPTIGDNGTPMSDQQAIQQYKQTGKHLGVYSNSQSADAYGKIIHQQQESAMKYAQPTALDPTQIEDLRKSLMTEAGQWDPTNANGLSGRMNSPNSQVDQQSQMNETRDISSQFRKGQI